jgi:hypothetical protein
MHGKYKGKKHPPFEKGSKEAKEASKKAVAARRKKMELKRQMKDWAIIFRDTPTKEDPNLTMGGAVVLEMYQAAIFKQDVKAAHFIAELLGELVEQVDIKNLPILRDDIPRAQDPT